VILLFGPGGGEGGGGPVLAGALVWTTNFTPPLPIENLTATIDEDLAWIRLEWDDWGGDPDHFWSYRIYRSVADARVLAGEVSDLATSEFVDSGPEVGEELTYEVVVYDGYAESATVLVATIIPGRSWWLGMPLDQGDTVRLRWVGPQAERVRNARMAASDRMGGRHPLVRTGVTQSPTGTLNINILDTDLSQLRVIERIADRSRLEPYCYLRTGLGESLKVKLGSVTTSFGAAGRQTVTIPYTTVAD
jgi:hypothetical protein